MPGAVSEERHFLAASGHSLQEMESAPHGATPPRLDRLELVPNHVELRVHDGNITKRPVSHFLDFVVNGESLIDLLVGGGDYVTNLNRAWVPAVVPTHVEVLLGRQPDEDLPAGRIPLLVCAVDGDVACGAITAGLSMERETVTWTDLRWEGGIGETSDVGGLRQSMTFDRRPYEQGLLAAAVRVSELPYDEAEHSLRRFLWPWQWGWRLPRD